MPDSDFSRLEQALVRAGQAAAYPPAPALSVRVRAELEREPAPRSRLFERRIVLALAALVLALGLLLAFPATRDALAQILGLRTIRILPATPTPTLPATAAPAVPPLATPTPTPFRIPTSTPVGSRIQCCATTLTDAQTRAKFKLLVPSSETPSRVYFQELPAFGGVQQAILVFGDPATPRATLYEATGFLYGKIVNGGTVIEETLVRGERALWLSGAPHALVYLDANGQPLFDSEKNVTGNTLAWEQDGVTFRLETALSKEQAIAFAESLH